jgi:SAM-dependent methyltransferase
MEADATSSVAAVTAGGSPSSDSDAADPLELQRLYGERFAGRTDYRNSVWQILCAQMFSRWIRPTDHVLDLGSGYCEFINNVTAKRKLAMDLNPDSAQRANPDVELVIHDCSTRWPIQRGSLDVVFTSNFLEHLFDKPALVRTLEQTFASLRPGGRLICLGPNVRYLPGLYWDYFDHYVALTDRSLGEALAQAGFTVEFSADRFLPYSMSEGRKRPLIALRVYLKVRPAWRLFGKQFLIVARKPSTPATV